MREIGLENLILKMSIKKFAVKIFLIFLDNKTSFPEICHIAMWPWLNLSPDKSNNCGPSTRCSCCQDVVIIIGAGSLLGYFFCANIILVG